MSAVAITCLLSVLALATDVGVLFRDKVNLQKVADAAAIAGAAEIYSGNYKAAAKASAKQNGVIDGTNGTVTVVLGTAYHPNAVKVYVSQQVQTNFMQLFRQGTISIGATSVAGITNGGDACIYALDKKPFKDQGLYMNGTGTVNAPTCAIYDNDSLLMDGTSGIINAKFIGVVGWYQGTGASPTPVTNMVPVDDPMKNWSTPPSYPSCAKDPQATSGTLSPGCYKGLTASGVTLNPGLYVVDGPLNLNGVAGTGVSFYVDGSQGGTLGTMDGTNMAAPTTGATGTCTLGGGCNGILMWDTESTGKAQQGVSFGPHGATDYGIFYFPNAALKYHGDTTTMLQGDIIALSFVLDGTIYMHNYVLSHGQMPLFASPTLLE